MILVDTSVWISHFRDGNSELEKLLYDGKVMIHPFVVGELACGSMKNRKEILELLQSLPKAVMAEENEVLQFIESNKLMGRGVGYIDVHLFASAVLSNVPIWTLDRKLVAIASKFNINFRKN